MTIIRDMIMRQADIFHLFYILILILIDFVEYTFSHVRVPYNMCYVFALNVAVSQILISLCPSGGVVVIYC